MQKVGKGLNYNASQQAKYNAALQKLVDQMAADVRKQVSRLFRGETADEYFDEQEELAAMDASIASQARVLMNKLIRKFNRLFALRALPLAETMVAGAAKYSKTQVTANARELSGNLALKLPAVPAGMEDVFKASVNENVALIKSIPQQYFVDVTGQVMRSITTGQGLADLIPALMRYRGVCKRRAKNIALDQTRKAYNSINKQRMQAAGIKQFRWIHSGGGQHPRRSHIALSGKIFAFDDLPVINEEQVARGYEGPVKGIPGQAINCRCTMVPIMDFELEDDTNAT